MKPHLWIFATLLPVSVFAATGSSSSQSAAIASTARLRFEPVSATRFIASGIRYHFSFEPKEVGYSNGKIVRRMRFDGASDRAMIQPAGKLPSVTNRYSGSDASRWQIGLPNYSRLEIVGLYPRINLVYYGSGDALEYDLKIQPGGNPSQIRLRFSGDSPKIDENGDLAGQLLHKSPIAYQVTADGTRMPVECRYRSRSDGTFGFAVGRYDHTRELVIDPVLTFSSYVAGSGIEYARAIGHDREGFLYVGGVTYSSDLIAAGNAEQAATGGSSDVFIAKIDPHAPAGASVVYTTYFGGSGAETLNDMVVSPSGTVYFTGSTTSSNLPTANAAQSTLAGATDAYVAWIDPAQGGSGLLYSTYLGGTGDDIANGITVDPSGRILVTGTTSSTDFPAIGAYQAASAGGQDAFVSGYDPSLSGSATIIYSTYLGGGGWDEGRSIAADASGNVWIAGGTFSYDFPLLGNSYQTGNRVSGDAFLVQLSLSAGVLYSTYLGGTGVDEATKVAVDSLGRILVTGYTSSSEFPVTPDAFQSQIAGSTDAFITIWKPVAGAAPQLTYSTFYGGGGGEVPYDIKSDADGILYLTGYTTSGDLPIAGALQSSRDGGLDAFALKLNPARSGGDALDYSSYIASAGSQIGYGIDLDSAGNVYVTGSTTGAMFDALNGAPRPTDVGLGDAFVSGFSACTIQLPFASQQFPTQGGSTTLSVSSSRDCRWTATSGADWVTVSPTNGNASGDVQINVAANTTGAERQATVTIGYATFLVGQNP